MAEWEAPITATVVRTVGESVWESFVGERASSRLISWRGLLVLIGRGPLVGKEPVQRTRRGEVMVVGSALSEGEMVTLHLLV